MYYFIEIACVIAELLICHMYFRSLFAEKKHYKFTLPIAYGIFGALLIFLSLAVNASAVRLLISVISLFVIALVFYKAKIGSAVFASLSFMTIYALTDVAVATIFTYCKIDSQLLFEDENIRSLYMLFTHIILVGVLVCISAFNRSKQGIVTLKSCTVFIPTWLASLCLCVIIAIQSASEPSSFHPLYTIVILGLFYTNILVVYFVNTIREKDRDKYENDIQERHYKLELKYYEQFHSQQEQVRALWHDISKYMKAMQSLIGEENSEKAEEAYNQAKSLVDEVDTVVDVGNRIVNVILNEYILTARSENIQVKLDVQIPSEIFVTVPDLYVIIGNTMDNAIRACCDCPMGSRYINIQIRMHNSILFYSTENPYVDAPTARNGIHGYGLKNVDRCIEKYDGNIEVSKDNNVFTVMITLSNSLAK